MQFRPLLFLCIVSLLFLVQPPLHAGNVLLIIADDLGRDSLSMYNADSQASLPPTPVLDELATQGILFNRAYSYATCSPTRASIITGRHSFRSGVTSPQDNDLQPNEFTLPEAILASGKIESRLAHFGKWHLGGGNDGPNTIGGWPHFAGALSGGLSNYSNWTKVTNGISQENYSVYATTDIVDDATRWINEQGDNSWFAWVAFNAPHTPFHKPDNELHSYDALSGTTNDINANPRPYYEAMVEAMDTEIDRLLESVDLTTTTVIFLGDNGSPRQVVQPPFIRSHAKGSLYEGGVNVPMIIAGAAVNDSLKNTRSETLVHTVDIYKTVLELLEIDSAHILPTELTFDSLSLAPVIQNSTQSHRNHIYTSTPSANVAIANQDYKWISFENGTQELYRLSDGVAESNDRSNSLTNEESFLISEFETLAETFQNIPNVRRTYIDSSGNFAMDIEWFANANLILSGGPELTPSAWQTITDFTFSDEGQAFSTIKTPLSSQAHFFQVEAR